jgi:hypothetical protein
MNLGTNKRHILLPFLGIGRLCCGSAATFMPLLDGAVSENEGILCERLAVDISSLPFQNC